MRIEIMSRVQHTRSLAIALLLLLQLHTAMGTDSVGGGILGTQPSSCKTVSAGKLRGFEVDKRDPDTPILQEITQGPSRSQQQDVKRIPAGFIVQVAAKPATAAMAEHKEELTALAEPLRSPRVQALAQAVVSQVDAVAAAAGVTAKVVRTYTHALAGFAMVGPTPQEIKALADNPNVLAIWPNGLQKLATYTTPEFLGLTSKQGENPHNSEQGEDSGVGHSNRRSPKGPSFRKGRKKPGIGGDYSHEYEHDHKLKWHKGRHNLPQDSYDTEGPAEKYPYEQQQQHGYDKYDHGGDAGYGYQDVDGYGQQGSSPYGPGEHESRPLWDQLGGVVGPRGAGEDVVVAVLDSGIWMDDHPSFADKDYWNTDGYGSNGQTYAPLARWNGTCQAGHDDTPFGCNNKVIGCRWFNSGWGDDLLSVFPYESLSCQDESGHGTHTAATAAGNYGAVSPFTPPGALLSGMAPRARIAVYKVCWGRDEFLAGCFFGDTIAAIDDAIKDGANVISASIGGGIPSSFATSVDLAYFNAAAWGIFISTSAGNSGPEEATVSGLAPWYMTVAASSQPRSVNGSVTLGDGQVVRGSAPAKQPASGPFPLIYAGDAAVDNTVYAARCEQDSLDDKLVAGHVVICDYGPYNNPQFQSEEVVRAGGVGLIAAITPEVQLTSRASPREYKLGIPYVQVSSAGREAALNYVWSDARPTVSFGAAEFSFHNTAPQMALFSSRGPAISVQQLVLKPDITAPGLNIHAATSPSYPPAKVSYDTYSGTSMSCPHISGIAALLIGRHPTMSPMEIKSAIMTTAYQLTKTGVAGKPFGTAVDYGAGHVDAQKAIKPGLVIRSTPQEMLAFMCKAEAYLWNDPPQECSSLRSDGSQTGGARQLVGAATPPRSGKTATTIDPSCLNPIDLNTPSVSGIVAGAMTVRRTLTAVLEESGGAAVHFESLAGPDAGSSFDIQLWPTEFSVANGQEVNILISISARPDTPMDKVQTGQIVWYNSRAGHRVGIPVAVTFIPFMALDGRQPQQFALDVPATVEGSSSYTYRISTSVTETVYITSGLQKGSVYTGEIEYGVPLDFSFLVPERTAYLAFALFSEDYPEGTDLDLYLYTVSHAPGNCNETKRDLVARSVSYTATELVYGSAIVPGEYVAEVKMFNDPGKPVNVYLLAWVIDEDGSELEQGLLTVTPDRLHMVPSDPCCCQVTATVTGLNATAKPVPSRYIGVIKYVTAAQQVLGNTTVLVF